MPLSSSAASNIFSAFSRRGGGGEGGLLSAARVAGKPLAEKGMVIISRDAQRAEALAARARQLGATVCELWTAAPAQQQPAAAAHQHAREGGGGGRVHAVPTWCSAAIVDDASCLDHSFATLAVFAAGLPPLKPSYLDAHQSAAAAGGAVKPVPPRAHEWAPRDLPSHRAPLGGALLESLHARRHAASGPRLFEGWRVALRPGCAAVTNSWATPLSEAQITALFASGGASVLSPGADVDVIFVGESSDVGSSAPRGVACCPLREWFKCLVGQITPGQLRADALGGATHRGAREGAAAARCAGSAAGVPTRGGRRRPVAAPGRPPPCRYHSPPPAPLAPPAGPVTADAGAAGKRRTRHSTAAPPAAAPSKRQRA